MTAQREWFGRTTTTYSGCPRAPPTRGTRAPTKISRAISPGYEPRRQGGGTLRRCPPRTTCSAAGSARVRRGPADGASAPVRGGFGPGGPGGFDGGQTFRFETDGDGSFLTTSSAACSAAWPARTAPAITTAGPQRPGSRDQLFLRSTAVHGVPARFGSARRGVPHLSGNGAAPGASRDMPAVPQVGIVAVVRAVLVLAGVPTCSGEARSSRRHCPTLPRPGVQVRDREVKCACRRCGRRSAHPCQGARRCRKQAVVRPAASTSSSITACALFGRRPNCHRRSRSAPVRGGSVPKPHHQAPG